MRLRACLLAALAGALSGVAFAAPAAAQATDATPTRALSLFEAGRASMKAGDYRDAREALAESARLDPHVGTFASLGECDEELGRLVAALDDWRRALAAAEASDDDRLATVRERLASVERRVPRLKLEIAAIVVGLRVRIDGAALDADAGLAPVPVDPGPHTVVVNAPGKRPLSTVVEARVGVVVVVSIPVLGPEPEPPVRVAHEVVPRAHPTRVAGWGLVGLAVAGAGTGAVFGLLAIEQRRAAQSACGSTYPVCAAPTKAAVEAHDAAGLDDAAVATVAFTVGGAALVTGLVLLAIPASDGAGAGVRMTAAVGPGRAGLVVGGVW